MINKMGEAADLILDGTLDEHTGEYLGEGDGYPRSYFNAKKYTGEGSVKMSTNKVMEYFKDYSIQELQARGLNIKLPGNGTVTVWWRKGKWTHSKNANKWFYFRNSPKEHANELIAQIEGLMGIGVTSVAKVAPMPSKTPVMDYVNVSKAGIELAILHITKKMEYGKANGGNNAVLTMLQTLIDELQQFL